MSMVYSTDDLSTCNLPHFKYWDKVKEACPKLKLTTFVIAEGLDESFDEWYEDRKDWVEIGVHCYNHQRPQEGWREDQEKWIKMARNRLKDYLPKQYLYRAPGFRVLPKTEKVLRDLGFAGIAHQNFIKYFNTGEKVSVFNTHCTRDEFVNPIGEIWQELVKHPSLV